MRSTSLGWFASLLLVACGSNSGQMPTGSTTSTPGDMTGPGSSGGQDPAGGNGASTGIGTVMADETLCGASVEITTTKTIDAGKTVAVCAGTVVTISSGASFSIRGTLVVQGTADKPVQFVGAEHRPGGWGGLMIASGGNVVAKYIEIHDALIAIDARAASQFQIDHILVDGSARLLSLGSDGTISHGSLHGLGSSQQATPVAISGSPHLVDTVVDKGIYGGLDLVVIGGAGSAPVFDHVEVADSHCAFHVNDAAGMTLTHSYVHHNAYAIMAGSQPAAVFSHNNFQDNSINIGSCGAITADVQENYFAGEPFDGSCLTLTAGSSAIAPYAADVGPRP